MGMPAYGRGVRLSTFGDNGMGAGCEGPSDAGDYTGVPGFYSYYEVTISFVYVDLLD